MTNKISDLDFIDHYQMQTFYKKSKRVAKCFGKFSLD